MGRANAGPLPSAPNVEATKVAKIKNTASAALVIADQTALERCCVSAALGFVAHDENLEAMLVTWAFWRAQPSSYRILSDPHIKRSATVINEAAAMLERVDSMWG